MGFPYHTSCDELASYDDVTGNAYDVIGAGDSLSGGGELTPRRAYAKYARALTRVSGGVILSF